VAIINALKWAGANISCREHLEDVMQRCKYDSSYGTYRKHMERALVELGVDYYTVVLKPNKLTEIEDHLQLSCGAVLVKFRWRSGNRHAALMTDISNDGRVFEIVGYRGRHGSAQMRVSREEVKSEILSRRKHLYCYFLMKHMHL